MRAYIATNILGSFAFDADGKVIAKKLFPKKPEVIAERLDSTGLVPEEEEVLRELKANGVQEVFIDKKAQFQGISLVFEEDHPGKKNLQEGFRGLAVQLGWVTSQAELNELLAKVQVLRTKEKLREERRDVIIIHAVRLLDELDKELNSFSERLREWYGLYFPELSKEIQSHEKFAEVVAKAGNREQAKGFEKLAKQSAGMEFSEADLQEVRDFSRGLLELYQRKKSLAKYLEGMCKVVAPNTSAVAGEILAARLLSHAGSLEKMSRLPSSTVQLLGAEKSLFRHLKGQGKAPKYGVLFAHPLIQQAPLDKRGKVARLLAAKISLAAKTDFFSKEDKGDALRQELEEQVKKAL
ncbi:MAG: hypothetical protein ISS93_01395 [Candidatus Aenigmarchaeota archaeon]|nr:hypothetical protein [Candidatus Aenigmarchaeota archaeon]